MPTPRPPGLHHNVQYWPGNEPWVDEGLSRRAWQARQFRAARKAKVQASVQVAAEKPVVITWRAPRPLYTRFRNYIHASERTKQSVMTEALERFLAEEDGKAAR